LDWNIVELLPATLQSCAHAEASWQIYKGLYAIKTAELKQEYHNGIKLRTDLSAALRQALKKNGVQATLPNYKKRWARPEIVQDLFDLEYGVRNNTSTQNHPQLIELAAIAERTGHKLAEMSAQHILDRPTNSAELEQRNRIATQLKAYMDEIREVARIALKNDPERLRHYLGKYPA
jgi:hypothetical protein